MKIREESALKVAEYLLRIKAIKLNLKTPYTWASGWKSPIYCDNRITLSHPIIRNYIRQQFVQLISEEFGDVDVIAGVATGGIAHGVLVAQELGVPFAYVRGANKDHGLTNKIEGVVESGQRVILIEDLISTGGSSMAAVKAMINAGANVKGLLTIFTYGFPINTEACGNTCKIFALSDYDNLLQQALTDNYVREEELAVLAQWRQDPANWNTKT
ncbi:MAG TPA: orotate phosphoribosyltransferase [Bacteroidales bacterium]|nr:orotate phosphoribosyltransferase [Bacteroidales bacterium]